MCTKNCVKICSVSVDIVEGFFVPVLYGSLLHTRGVVCKIRECIIMLDYQRSINNTSHDTKIINIWFIE